jgi:uncharacterized iron-regulated membrane protein
MVLSRWWLPDWLYEPLPFIYVGGGLLAMATFEDALGVVAGVLLSLSGIATWLVRRRHRLQRPAGRRPPRPRRREPAGGNGTASARSYYNHVD